MVGCSYQTWISMIGSLHALQTLLASYYRFATNRYQTHQWRLKFTPPGVGPNDWQEFLKPKVERINW